MKSSMIGALIAGWVALVATNNFTNNNIRENFRTAEGSREQAANPKATDSSNRPSTSDSYQQSLHMTKDLLGKLPTNEPAAAKSVSDALSEAKRARTYLNDVIADLTGTTGAGGGAGGGGNKGKNHSCVKSGKGCGKKSHTGTGGGGSTCTPACGIKALQNCDNTDPITSKGNGGLLNHYRGGATAVADNPMAPRLDVTRKPGASNACEVAIFGTGANSIENEVIKAVDAKLGGPAGSRSRTYPTGPFKDEIAYANAGIENAIPQSQFGTGDGFAKNFADYKEAVDQQVELATQNYIGGPATKPGWRTQYIDGKGVWNGPAALKANLIKAMELQKELQITSYNATVQSQYQQDRKHAMSLYQCRAGAPSDAAYDASICPVPGAGAVSQEVVRTIPGCENANDAADCEKTLQLKWFGGVNQTQQTMDDKYRKNADGGILGATKTSQGTGAVRTQQGGIYDTGN